jgi:hypothetical protein
VAVPTFLRQVCKQLRGVHRVLRRSVEGITIVDILGL